MAEPEAGGGVGGCEVVGVSAAGAEWAAEKKDDRGERDGDPEYENQALLLD
jgi:hypothetical protein